MQPPARRREQKRHSSLLEREKELSFHVQNAIVANKRWVHVASLNSPLALYAYSSLSRSVIAPSLARIVSFAARSRRVTMRRSPPQRNISTLSQRTMRLPRMAAELHAMAISIVSKQDGIILRQYTVSDLLKATPILHSEYSGRLKTTRTRLYQLSRAFASPIS